MLRLPQLRATFGKFLKRIDKKSVHVVPSDNTQNKVKALEDADFLSLASMVPTPQLVVSEEL